MPSQKILVVFQPWRKISGSLHQQLTDGLKSLGYDVDYLDTENPPPFQNKNLTDKFRNIYERLVHRNKLYSLIAHKNHVNRFYRKKIAQLPKDKMYDLVLIIKPEEYTTQNIEKLSRLGNKTVGYIWDGLRLFFKPSLVKSLKYLDGVYSFDIDNIADHPDLDMKFLTNYYIPDIPSTPFDSRKTDVFYVGSLAGTLDTQRRDWKLAELAKFLSGNIDISIFAERGFLNNDHRLVDSTKIKYITSPTSIEDTLEKTKNSKIVIDICKKHHIGLSFRFFECMLYETKIITNNADVVNYDFYNPDNILVVDFDNIEKYKDKILDFQKKPYKQIPEEIKTKYSLDNWIKILLNAPGSNPIVHKNHLEKK
ncbi:Uncharacterised protein [Chryseobacterium taklimakanense]|uniref:Glycosyltransferase family 1 protein n=1 Tax=Chryseobacterium taklimakanense TaxID=536441 RepID=A0A239XPF2_9FLAO|nr:glycosyltransferase [Chryseobacterium taklimakanense]SNV47914.1 Uncharacterised protein [Chryseobacterium taklimakanense]